ncbi:MAG: N(4)-(beta-N-acetylglucosaminyl)-L-asparaginase [Planctomycetota bacterium]|nr:N(4)-(beta-N-acetylglucosaminyl)-L-asparaginase [Planctomycetota bacterium]
MNTMNRRSFLTTAAALPAIASIPMAEAKPHEPGRLLAQGRPISVSSGNGIRAVEKAVELLRQGSDPLDAVVAGVNIVESDPEDMSVGYGGLPNERGVVQLDSCVMHGPTHKAGAVACIENIMNPASVALKVCRRTDHVLLVGEGAKQFAIAQGFKEEDLLTEKARKIWLRWKENLNPNDDWLNEDQIIGDAGKLEARAEALGLPFHYGTIHCSGVDAEGNIGSVTTTSGLSYKIPGRVGDSPLIGAGNFCDNAVGAGGSTGRGEAVIQSCGGFQVVQNMANGDDPTEACLKVLKWVADHTRRHDLLNSKGQPNFSLRFYALRKDGAYGGACFRKNANGNKKYFAVHDGEKAYLHECAYLYDD